MQEELNKLSKTVEDLDAVYPKIVDEFRFLSKDDMYASLGYKSITINQITKYIKDNSAEYENSPVMVVGEENLTKITLPKCCCPIFGDEIVGVKSKNGVTVHTKNCLNLKGIDSSRIVDVAWKANPNCLFDVNLKIVAKDKPGYGWKLLKLIADGNYNMTKIVGKMVNSSDCEFNICVSVKNTAELNKLVSEIKTIEEVKTITRYFD